MLAVNCWGSGGFFIRIDRRVEGPTNSPHLAKKAIESELCLKLMLHRYGIPKAPGCSLSIHARFFPRVVPKVR